MSIKVDDHIEVNKELPQRRGARPDGQARSWPLFQVTHVYCDGTFHAVSCDVPTEIPILRQDNKSGPEWRPSTSVAAGVCRDIALFARVCYAHQTKCTDDMQRVKALVKDPDATDVATKLLESLLVKHATLSSSPTFATAAKKLIKWAEVSPDSLRRVKLPDTAYGFHLAKCDESKSGYKGVTQCGDINADRAWRVYIAKVHLRYTDDAVEGAVWFAQAYEGRWDLLPPGRVKQAKEEAERKLNARKQAAGSIVVKMEGPVVPTARLHGAVINLYSSSEASDSEEDGHAPGAGEEAAAAKKTAAAANKSEGGEMFEGGEAGASGERAAARKEKEEMAVGERTAVAGKTASSGERAAVGETAAAGAMVAAGAMLATRRTTAGEWAAPGGANAVGGAVLSQGGTDVWQGALKRKRKRQEDARNASHFGPLAKLDEFFASESNQDELREYVQEQSGVSPVTARRFREALQYRYGDANAPATAALENGRSMKRQRLETAARSSTFDEFADTFGSDGSMAEFKEYMNMQVSGDLEELDEYLVTDTYRTELFEKLQMSGRPTLSAVDEFRTSLLGRYGQPCVDDFPRVIWE